MHRYGVYLYFGDTMLNKLVAAKIHLMDGYFIS